MISIHRKNQVEISKNIQQYKQNGIVKFDSLLSVPFKDRLPGLVEQYGSQKIHALLVVMLTNFCNFYNVVRPMTAEQITSCAFEIMNSSSEDYLSIEDLTIFFDGAKSSKYGRVLDHLDQHVIFEMLETYRQERHTQYQNFKEEKQSNYKSMGDNFRLCDDLTEIKNLFHQANVEYFKSTQSAT